MVCKGLVNTFSVERVEAVPVCLQQSGKIRLYLEWLLFFQDGVLQFKLGKDKKALRLKRRLQRLVLGPLSERLLRSGFLNEVSADSGTAGPRGSAGGACGEAL